MKPLSDHEALKVIHFPYSKACACSGSGGGADLIGRVMGLGYHKLIAL